MPAPYRRPARLGLALVALLAAGGSALASDFSESAEKVLGKYVRWIIESSLPLDEDPLLNGIVETIGRDIAAAGGRESIEHHYRILDVEDVNALAAPGGYVWVTKGILRYVESPDELAGIIGHETGHVSERHGWQAFKEDMAYTALLLGTPLGADYGLLQWIDGAYFVAGLKMSRDDEYEADRAGAEYALAAGYDVRRMPEFFQRMLDDDGERLNRVEVFFSTHPAHEDRIDRIHENLAFAADAPAWMALGDGYLSRRLFTPALECYQAALAADGGAEAACRAAVAAAFAGRGEEAQSLLYLAEGSMATTGAATALALRDAREVVQALAGADTSASLLAMSAADRDDAVGRLSQAVAAIDEVTAEIKPQAERIEQRRVELAETLRTAASIADGYARMFQAPQAVGASLGGDSLTGASNAFRGYRQAAVASDARTDEAVRALGERRALLEELRGHIEAGRGGPRCVELAASYADRTADLSHAVGEALRCSDEAVAALERGAEEIAAEPQSLLARRSPAMRSMRSMRALPGDGALRAAVQFDRNAEEALAVATLESALLALSIEGATSGAPAAALDQAVARLLGLKPSDLTDAGRVSSDLGDRALVAAVMRQTGCGLDQAAGLLADDRPLTESLRLIGADGDNLAIACRLVARALHPPVAAP